MFIKLNIFLSLVLLISSCSIKNNDKGKVQHVVINEDGDSIVYVTIGGVKQGRSTVYYKSGMIKKEFFYKNNLLDSTFNEYYENGNPKYSLYFIGGKENGYMFEYSKHYKSGISKVYFYVNGIIVIVGMLDQPMDTNSYKYDYFINLAPDSLIHIGSLIGNNIGIIRDSSSYYRIESEMKNGIPAYSYTKNIIIRFIFYPIFKNSDIRIVIKHAIQLDSNSYSVVSKEKVGINGEFVFKLKNKTKGWHYLRGYFTESVDDDKKGEMTRRIPIYFNFYVY